MQLKRSRRFLFAWELGGNSGHLVRCAALARALRNRGHEVLFAVRDTRTAYELLTPHNLSYIQAPRLAAERRGMPPCNYSEMLWVEGYADEAGLRGALASWIDLIKLFSPDALVADHAPTALLAARIRGIPAAAIGSGFDLPPLTTPLPSMRPWEQISESRLANADSLLRSVMNRALGAYGARHLQNVSDLFGGVLRVFVSFSELDHYGARAGERYGGNFARFAGGREKTWPQGDAARVLAYLRPDVPGVQDILAALHASSYRVICALPGADEHLLNKFSRPGMNVFIESFDFDFLLRDSDMAIGYGSIGFTTLCLQAGVPMLIRPSVVEQVLCGRRAAALGAAIMMEGRQDVVAYGSCLTRLLHEAHFRIAAGNFSERYRSHDASFQLAGIAREVESLTDCVDG